MPHISISGGGQRSCSSLYLNYGGSRKTISSAYGNISGSRKQIFPYSATTTTTYYYWKRYNIDSTGGTVSYTAIGNKVKVGGSEGDFHILIGYGESCIGNNGSLYMTWEDSRHLYYVSDACGWGKYFAIVSSVPSSNRIYAKDTFDGNIYKCDHNMYWGSDTDGKKCVMCHYEENCVKKVSCTQGTKIQGSYIDEVSSTIRSKYPDNNYSGSYWYVYDRSNTVYS